MDAAYTQPFASFNGRLMMEVRCKGACQTKLLVRRGPAQNLRIDKTPDYGEVTFVMTNADGQASRHVTAMCRACRDRLLMLGPRDGELAAIYNQDYLQWIDEEMRANRSSYKSAEAMAQQFRNRVAERVEP